MKRTVVRYRMKKEKRRERKKWEKNNIKRDTQIGKNRKPYCFCSKKREVLRDLQILIKYNKRKKGWSVFTLPA